MGDTSRWPNGMLSFAATSPIGAVLLKAYVISTGQTVRSGVRSLSGGSDAPYPMVKLRSVSVHAEANAIIRASFDLMDDATLYIFGHQQEKPRSGMPCFMCWRMIFNAGIGKVIFLDDEGQKKIVNVKVVDRCRILSYSSRDT